MAESIVTHPTDEALHAHRARLDQCECPYCVPPEREPVGINGPPPAAPRRPLETLPAEPPYWDFRDCPAFSIPIAQRGR